MSADEAKPVETTETVTEAAPAVTEQAATTTESGNATSKSMPGTPTNDKSGLFPKLKRNLTTKLHNKTESEKEGETQTTDYANQNDDQNLTTPTSKSSKRLSARANEIFSDIRGAFKQPLISPVEPKEGEDAKKKDEDKTKTTETTAEPVVDDTTATATEGETNQAQNETADSEKPKKDEAKLNRRLTVRVQDLVRGAWKQPLVSPAGGKKEETPAATTAEASEHTAKEGENATTTEVENADASKSSPKQTSPPAFGSWLHIFGGSKSKEDATKVGESQGETTVSGLPAADEGEGNVETAESPTSKPNKENSFFAIFHNLVNKDHKKEEDTKKESEDKGATEDAEPKMKLPFFKRRKSSQKEVTEAANSTEPNSEEAKPTNEGETTTKEAVAAPKSETVPTTETVETSDKNETKKEEEVKKD